MAVGGGRMTKAYQDMMEAIVGAAITILTAANGRSKVETGIVLLKAGMAKVFCVWLFFAYAC